LGGHETVELRFQTLARLRVIPLVLSKNLGRQNRQRLVDGVVGFTGARWAVQDLVECRRLAGRYACVLLGATARCVCSVVIAGHSSLSLQWQVVNTDHLYDAVQPAPDLFRYRMLFRAYLYGNAPLAQLLQMIRQVTGIAGQLPRVSTAQVKGHLAVTRTHLLPHPNIRRRGVGDRKSTRLNSSHVKIS